MVAANSSRPKDTDVPKAPVGATPLVELVLGSVRPFQIPFALPFSVTAIRMLLFACSTPLVRLVSSAMAIH